MMHENGMVFIHHGRLQACFPELHIASQGYILLRRVTMLLRSVTYCFAGLHIASQGYILLRRVTGDLASFRWCLEGCQA